MNEEEEGGERTEGDSAQGGRVRGQRMGLREQSHSRFAAIHTRHAVTFSSTVSFITHAGDVWGCESSQRRTETYYTAPTHGTQRPILPHRHFSAPTGKLGHCVTYSHSDLVFGVQNGVRRATVQPLSPYCSGLSFGRTFSALGCAWLAFRCGIQVDFVTPHQRGRGRRGGMRRARTC